MEYNSHKSPSRQQYQAPSNAKKTSAAEILRDQQTYDNTRRNSTLRSGSSDNRHVIFEYQLPPDRSRNKSTPRPVGSSPRSRPLSGTVNGISSMDHWIGQGGGTTSTLEFLPHRLKISKNKDSVPKEKRIEELTRENGYLRQELAYHKETQVAIMRLYDSAQTAVQRLQHALTDASQRIAISENRLLEYWTIKRKNYEEGYSESRVF